MSKSNQTSMANYKSIEDTALLVYLLSGGELNKVCKNFLNNLNSAFC